MKTPSRSHRENVRENAKPKRRRPPLRLPVVQPGEELVILTEDERAMVVEAMARRALNGWSQEELALRVGVRRTTWQHIERQRRGFSFRVGLGIARAFDSGVDVFLEAGKKRLF